MSFITLRKSKSSIYAKDWIIFSTKYLHNGYFTTDFKVIFTSHTGLTSRHYPLHFFDPLVWKGYLGYCTWGIFKKITGYEASSALKSIVR